MTFRRLWMSFIVCLMSGCSTYQRLADIGSPPKMTPTANPTAAAGYAPVSLPGSQRAPTSPSPGSLWQTGARDFLKDQRASEVGDLVTIIVNVADTAALHDQTTISRNSAYTLGVPNILGLATLFPHIFGNTSSNTATTSSSSPGSTDTTTGNGQVIRNETVTLRLAGVVTQVLANGSLLVVAHQEMRVNNELRVLTVSGIVRPQDIASDNTVTHDRIAEARISYGGRGDVTNAQSAPYGQQALGILAPF